jgi:hypothetical protein
MSRLVTSEVPKAQSDQAMSTNYQLRALAALALSLGALAVERSARAQPAPSAGFPVESPPASSSAAPPAAPPPASPLPASPPASAAPPTNAAPPAPPPAAPPPPVAPAATAPATPPPDPSGAATPVAPPAAPAPAPAPPPDVASWGAPPPSDGEALVQRPELVKIEFEDEPGWAVGLDAYAGLAALFGTDTRSAYSLAGGTLRGRYRHYEIGAFFEATDTLSGGGEWQNVGGFAGAWLPYRNWVDFEIALRVGGRKFSDSDLRYGSNGYELWSPTLGLALGVSDRAGKGTWGGRIGSQLVATYDLKQRDRPWQLVSIDPETGNQSVASGSSHVGGFSLQLVVTLGFDAGDGA